MNKVLLTVALVGSALLAGFAQTGTLTLKDRTTQATLNNTTIDIWGDSAATTIMSYIYDAYNSSGAAKTYYKERQMISEVTGSENYFCWDVCYPPFVATSPNGVLINAASTYLLGSCDYKPMGFLGTTSIRYVFWDYINVNDSSWFIINWHATALSIPEHISGTLKPAFPNPASTSTQINYSFDGASTGALRVFDMLGNLVKEIAINNNKGLINLHVGELESGIYFYSLVANDKVLSTKKLVVTR